MLHGLVKGIADGCRRSGCALIGGETANMPDLYAKGDFDLAGFCVGVVDLKRVQKPTRVRVGDVILGLSSDGVHSNGYTLVRDVVKQAGLDLSKVYPELSPPPKKARRSKKVEPVVEKTLGEVLLTPTRLYADPIVRLLRSYRVKTVVSGMAHITGSGIGGNLCRALPPTMDALIDMKAWERPPVFGFLQKHGNIDEEEMYRVFNLGIGYCVIVSPPFAESVTEQLTKFGEKVWRIGEVVKGTGQVRRK